MHITVVDNHTYHLGELKDLLSTHKVEICDYEDLADYDFEKSDLIILSGGHHLSVENHHQAYKNELDIVLASDKPLFGICLGFQIICAAYGNHLSLLDHKIKGLVTVEKLLDDPIFDGIDEKTFTVSEAHRWVVEKAENLDVLAKSDYGIEVVKVPGRLHYGVQFHPEMFVKESLGHVFLENFLSFL